MNVYEFKSLIENIRVLNILDSTSFVLSFNSEELLIKNEFFSSFSDGLYFVGLDAHVGYLYVKNNQVFFLHSNYIENRVMIESIDSSEAFNSFNYHVVRITRNQDLMKSWILNSEIFIHKS